MTEWQRIELHNHTTDSDGQMDALALFAFMCGQKVPAFAVTDHNTLSGFSRLQSLPKESRHACTPVPGLEFTTWFGHILCLGDARYRSWHDLDPDAPDAWLTNLRDSAHPEAVKIGLAHPYANNHTRNRLKIRDWALLDFIEVVNNAQPFETANLPAMKCWESLVLAGHRLAATTGMDLHAPRSLEGCFTTFIPKSARSPASQASKPETVSITHDLLAAISHQQTILTRGPLLTGERMGNFVRCTLAPGLTPIPEGIALTLVVSTARGEQVHTWENPLLPLHVPGPEGSLVLRVHTCNPEVEETERNRALLVVAPPIWT